MIFRWVVSCTVVLDGIPKGQPRSRSRKGQRGVYTPDDADDWKTIVRKGFLPHRPLEPYDEPLRLDIDFGLPRPRTFNKRVRDAYGGSSRNIPDGRVLHLSTPDRDNLDKAVLDALKNLGFFRDDSVVCWGTIRKFYHAKGGRPGANIRVSRWVMTK